MHSILLQFRVPWVHHINVILIRDKGNLFLSFTIFAILWLHGWQTHASHGLLNDEIRSVIHPTIHPSNRTSFPQHLLQVWPTLLQSFFYIVRDSENPQ